MSASEIRSFNESSEFAAAIRGVNADLTFVGSGPFSAEIIRVELDLISIQRITESLPLVLHSSDPAGYAVFGFRTQPEASLVRDGIEVAWDTIVYAGMSQSLFERSSGPMSWGSISLRGENLSLIDSATTGLNLAPPSKEKRIKPRPEALATLRRVHEKVASVAKDAPDLIKNPKNARDIEANVIQALIGCLDNGEIQDKTPAQQRHHAIMQRFHAILDAEADRPLYVLEMATAVGASLRTLSACCLDHLGMGPKKYLFLRRMHLARQALLVADPAVTTVTEVATRFGFWQFGRFAGEYKSLFGESPSATLRRARAV